MPTVYDLTGWARRLADIIDAMPEDAEDVHIGDAIAMAADAYEGAIEDKVEAIGHVLDAFADHRDLAKREAARYGRIAKLWDRRRDRVRGLLDELLTSHETLTGSPKVRTTSGTATLSERTVYTYPASVDDWPEPYVETVTQVRPDRAAAKAAIDAGASYEGFSKAVVKIPMWRPVK